MAIVDVYASGNGVAYVDNPNPYDGDSVTLYAEPYTGETLDDIVAVDQQGHSIALSPSTQIQTFTYRSSWGTVSITVTFSGGTPPTPPRFPIWLLKKIADNNRHY